MSERHSTVYYRLPKTRDYTEDALSNYVDKSRLETSIRDHFIYSKLYL